MANERLRIDITAKDNASGTINNVNKAMVRTAKSTKNSGQAFTQLAYALDDAQYGFRGIQNNIQAIAVSAGLGGPLILAITAATVALGFFIDKWQEGSKEAKSTIDTMIQEIKELRGELGIDTKDDPVTKLISNHRKAIAAAKKELEALKKEETVTTTTGYNTFRTTRTVGTEEEIRKAAEKVRFLEKQLQQDVTRIHQQESAKRNKQTVLGYEKTYKELQDKLKKLANTKRDRVEGIGSITPSGSSLDELKKWQRQATNLMRSFALAWGAEWKNVGKITVAGGDEVANGIRATADRLGHTLKTTQEEVTDAGSAFQTAAASAFSGIGTAIGEALAGEGDFGDKFLKVLGSFMIQFGSALIALGIAESAWLSSFDPGTKIAAGAALVIAGAAISSIYSSKPGGGTKNTTYSSEQGSRFVQSQSDTSHNAPIAIARIKGQDLELAIQNANYSRQGYIPT